MGKIRSTYFGWHQHIISSIHRQRKVLSDMLHNYAPCVGQEAYWMGMTNILMVKMRNKIRFILEGINTLSHQCIGWERWYVILMMPLVWTRCILKGNYLEKFCSVKMGILCAIFGGHQCIISSMHRWIKLIYYLMMPP